MRITLSAALLAVALLGCQTYDFEPVQPLALAQTTQSRNVVARQNKPNIMLLVDKSGSMDFKVDASCTTNCPTRISDLKVAMANFLGSSGAVARMGLAYFPSGTRCEPTNAVEVALPAPASIDDAAQDAINQTNASLINSRIQAVTASGGTPTGQSLTYVGNLPALNENDAREDFVLLLTDGLPNCNPNNANDCNNAPACACTLSSCAGTFCREGCLDRQGVVDQVQALRAKTIKTVVVGFGADTAAGDAPDVLNAMAEAGGFARSCPQGTDAECGSNNRCLAGNICEKKFYQATNGTELATALANISAIINQTNICEFTLESTPSDPRYLAVIIDGANSPSGPDTWQYNAGKVTFQGALCDRIKVATPNAPVKVEIRIVEKL